MCMILIVYHSRTGNTKKMAEQAAAGAASIDGVTVALKTAAGATVHDLLSCRGLIIGSPEYFGSMAGMIKDFFDRTYYDALDKPGIAGKPYGLFISAGNDGTGALNSIKRICAGYRFREVFKPVIAAGAVTGDILARCEELGATIAAGCREQIY